MKTEPDIIEFTNVLATLTRTQEECTRLLLKVRELESRLGYRETQLSISEWANETFGASGSSLRVVTRANEEMAELLGCLSIDDASPKALEEIADVFIVLYRAAWRLGGDVHAAIDRKRWRSTGLVNGNSMVAGTVTT